MADNLTVTNQKTTFDADSNSDMPVRTTETAGSKHLQHVRLDLGHGSTEAQVVGVGVSSAPTSKGFGVLATAGHYSGSDAVEAGSTSSVINLTAHAMRVNDYIHCFNGIAANNGAWATIESVTANTITLATALPVNPNAADTILFFRPMPLSMSSTSTQTGGLIVNVDSDYQESTARGLLKLESTIHNSGDAGVAVWGVRNDAGATTFATDQRYSPMATDAAGRVGIADLGGSITVDTQTATVGTRSQVSDNAADVQILASNTSRKGATIFNDSSAILYLGLGTTAASTTNYTAKLFTNSYYEVPASYTGEIRGIWATDPNDGAARVTELT